MPELAEVECFRKVWSPGFNQKIEKVLLHTRASVFRNTDPTWILKTLPGRKLQSSAAAAKQMLFQFSGGASLGIHLGMTGELKIEAPTYTPGKHDHMVLVQAGQCLVFKDFRMFGSVQFSVGKKTPDWWSQIAPAITSSAFTIRALQTFLNRRRRTSIKAVLLMQERFPGIGNWMADEILWRAEIHPAKKAGDLTSGEVKALHKESKWVCRQALKIIGDNWGDLPNSWLFNHRWKKGGICPETGAKLRHATIGGRTTCWSPGRQVPQK